MLFGLGPLAGAPGAAAGAAGAADWRVRHQLRVSGRAHAAQVSHTALLTFDRSLHVIGYFKVLVNKEVGADCS